LVTEFTTAFRHDGGPDEPQALKQAQLALAQELIDACERWQPGVGAANFYAATCRLKKPLQDQELCQILLDATQLE
jgi:hypothetical protein